MSRKPPHGQARSARSMKIVSVEGDHAFSDDTVLDDFAKISWTTPQSTPILIIADTCLVCN